MGSEEVPEYLPGLTKNSLIPSSSTSNGMPRSFNTEEDNMQAGGKVSAFRYCTECVQETAIPGNESPVPTSAEGEISEKVGEDGTSSTTELANGCVRREVLVDSGDEK
jgi:hypothetical protein